MPQKSSFLSQIRKNPTGYPVGSIRTENGFSLVNGLARVGSANLSMNWRRHRGVSTVTARGLQETALDELPSDIGCVGSQTARDSAESCDSDSTDVAVRLCHGVGIPEYCNHFTAQYPACEFPLSTLPRRPHGRQDMTRGQCARYPLPVLIGAATSVLQTLPRHHAVQ